MRLFFVLLLGIFSYGFDFNYKSITADFNQSVQTEDGKKIFYSGKIYAKVPDLMLWHYKEPIEKKIWINFSKVEVYEPNLIQVTIYNNSSKDNFFKLLKDSKKIDNNTYIKHFNDKDIYFKVSKDMLNKIFYKDKIDNLVEIKFFNQKTDTNINSNIFIPTYPEYIDKIYAK